MPTHGSVRLLNDDGLERLHEGAVALLSDPGMRIEADGLLAALKRRGAQVDAAQSVVRFPRAMVEDTIALAAAEDRERLAQAGGDLQQAQRCCAFSWHTGFPDGVPRPRLSIGGGCPMFYRLDSRVATEATARDCLDVIRFAESVPEIATVGNPVHCVRDFDGRRVPPRMVAIRGAALVAKNSSKPGSTALMYPEQLDYLIEMGSVVRGGYEQYVLRPLFININDTTPPLQLSRHEGAVIEALAARRLPVYILPMPLLGIAGPMTLLSNAMVGAAEILGVWSAVKAFDAEVPVECSIVSGVLEPRTGGACFSGPEPAWIDAAVAQLFRRRYGLRCGPGVGFIDAPIPGTAAAFERTLKASLLAGCGEFAYPVGILAAGNIFSPEQVLIDMDLASGLFHFFAADGGSALDEELALVRERGIGGRFFDTEHTAANFRQTLWFPNVFCRTKTKDAAQAERDDPVRRAHDLWRRRLASSEPFRLADDKAAEIDRIVARAESHLVP
jgi:trimethylamine:corrinoid methyltransferase-like protein